MPAAGGVKVKELMNAFQLKYIPFVRTALGRCDEASAKYKGSHMLLHMLEMRKRYKGLRT